MRHFNKHGNIRCEFNGIKFDSQVEMFRYHELLLLEKAGEIKNLECHKSFEIIPKQKGERAAKYTPDFYYIENGKAVAEEIKGEYTKTEEAYILRRKLFKLNYPDIEFREIVY